MNSWYCNGGQKDEERLRQSPLITMVQLVPMIVVHKFRVRVATPDD